MNRLTQKQRDELWGEDGPYSQVQLIIEERILYDSISRVFVIVSVNINPFTFKLVKKYREKFSDDEVIQGLLDHSENQGQKDGYCCHAFTCEYSDEDVMKAGKEMLKRTRDAVLLMHRFVMDELGIGRDAKKAGKVVHIHDISRKVH